jgi:hypothetical protein
MRARERQQELMRSKAEGFDFGHPVQSGTALLGTFGLHCRRQKRMFARCPCGQTRSRSGR